MSRSHCTEDGRDCTEHEALTEDAEWDHLLCEAKERAEWQVMMWVATWT